MSSISGIAPTPSLPLSSVVAGFGLATICETVFQEAKTRFESYTSEGPPWEKYFVSFGIISCSAGVLYNLYLGDRINQAVFFLVGLACGAIGRYLELTERQILKREGESEELKKTVILYETALEDRQLLLASLQESEENREHLTELVEKLRVCLNELTTVSLFFQTYRKDLQKTEKNSEIAGQLDEIKKILARLEQKSSDIHRDLLAGNEDFEERGEKTVAGKTTLA